MSTLYFSNSSSNSLIFISPSFFPFSASLTYSNNLILSFSNPSIYSNNLLTSELFFAINSSYSYFLYTAVIFIFPSHTYNCYYSEFTSEHIASNYSFKLPSSDCFPSNSFFSWLPTLSASLHLLCMSLTSSLNLTISPANYAFSPVIFSTSPTKPITFY